MDEFEDNKEFEYEFDEDSVKIAANDDGLKKQFKKFEYEEPDIDTVIDKKLQELAGNVKTLKLDNQHLSDYLDQINKLYVPINQIKGIGPSNLGPGTISIPNPSPSVSNGVNGFAYPRPNPTTEAIKNYFDFNTCCRVAQQIVKSKGEYLTGNYLDYDIFNGLIGSPTFHYNSKLMERVKELISNVSQTPDFDEMKLTEYIARGLFDYTHFSPVIRTDKTASYLSRSIDDYMSDGGRYAGIQNPLTDDLLQSETWISYRDITEIARFLNKTLITPDPLTIDGALLFEQPFEWVTMKIDRQFNNANSYNNMVEEDDPEVWKNRLENLFLIISCLGTYNIYSKEPDFNNCSSQVFNGKVYIIVRKGFTVTDPGATLIV